MLGTAAMGVVSLYQTGVLGHLPEPPLRFLDSDRVDASGEAYALLRAPDVTLEQATKHRAFCSYCLLAAGASVASVPLVLPEAKAALAHLTGH